MFNCAWGFGVLGFRASGTGISVQLPGPEAEEPIHPLKQTGIEFPYPMSIP